MLKLIFAIILLTQLNDVQALEEKTASVSPTGLMEVPQSNLKIKEMNLLQSRFFYIQD
jgi:hypothetical protein